MAKKVKKTLIEKFLEQEKIPYTGMSFVTHLEGDVYAIDEKADKSIEDLIFKTLVVTGRDTGPLVGIVPISERLDYKKLCHLSGNKKIGLVPLKNLVKTSGYVHGANSPIGIYNNKHLPIYYDESINSFDEIIISAGEVGRMLKIKPQVLVEITHGTIGDITERNDNV